MFLLCSSYYIKIKSQSLLQKYLINKFLTKMAAVQKFSTSNTTSRHRQHNLFFFNANDHIACMYKITKLVGTLKISPGIILV